MRRLESVASCFSSCAFSCALSFVIEQDWVSAQGAKRFATTHSSVVLAGPQLVRAVVRTSCFYFWFLVFLCTMISSSDESWIVGSGERGWLQPRARIALLQVARQCLWLCHRLCMCNVVMSSVFNACYINLICGLLQSVHHFQQRLALNNTSAA